MDDLALTLTSYSLVAVAKAIAIAAHAGQVDKSGVPYIEHPLRVATRVHRGLTTSGARPDDYAIAVCAALLHDVIEDTAVTYDDLAIAGMPDAVIDRVRLLTKGEHETNRDYILRLRDDAIAALVKYHDLMDNLDDQRMARLDEATVTRLRDKYAKALFLLGYR